MSKKIIKMLASALLYSHIGFLSLVLLNQALVYEPLYSECFLSDTSAQRIERIERIIIDAGHGGEDCGAIGQNGLYEKDLNMQIALKLGEYLSAAGYEVVYTRTEDKLLYTEEQNVKGMRKIYDLKNRMEIANGYERSLLVSVHMNSYGTESCSGFQAYYAVGSESSKRAAESVHNSVVRIIQPTNRRKIKDGKGLYLMENSQNPAILVECGFISNIEECKKLSEKEYQKELCFAILCGIIEYIRSE